MEKGDRAMHITESYLMISSAVVHANNNRANHGGAIILMASILMSISNFALVSYIGNRASSAGGTIFSDSYIGVGESSILLVFRNNSAHQGGAVYLQHVTGMTRMDIRSNSQARFYYNSAEQ